MNRTADPDGSLQHLRTEAASGDPRAVYALAGALVARQQLEEAFALFRQASEAGHVPARIQRARMQLHGIATDVDVAEGVRQLEAAEAGGSPVASCLLAQVAIGGVALPRDQRINQRVLAAIEAGYPPALRAAAIHFGRRDDPQDQAICLDLLGRAAAAGDALAARLLAARQCDDETGTADPDAGERYQRMPGGSGNDPLPACTAPVPHGVSMPRGRLALEEAWQVPPVRGLSARPRVRSFDALLSRDECRLLMASAEPALRRSQTIDPASGDRSRSRIRTSRDASFDPLQEDLALRLVQARMASAEGAGLANAEHLIVLNYAPGEEYRPHRDYLPPATIAADRPSAGDRAGTICAYLNDVEAGGATVFPAAGVRIEPRAGAAVAFDNLLDDGRHDPDSLHAGLPVERGQKWLATLWIRQGRYRDF